MKKEEDTLAGNSNMALEWFIILLLENANTNIEGDWVENSYSRLAVEVLSKLSQSNVALIDVEKWKEMSIGRLAGLRTRELFDIALGWPNSSWALDDLRTAVNTPQRRRQLTDVFSADLQQRLLHPGASTLQILRGYICIIWSFHSLDHSRVLLERVSYPLEDYLRSREDTIKIIITGLLSDTEDAFGDPIETDENKLVELAILLNEASEYHEQGKLLRFLNLGRGRGGVLLSRKENNKKSCLSLFKRRC